MFRLSLVAQTLFGCNHIAPQLDNMDQRIAADCRSLASGFGGLIFGGGLTSNSVSIIQTLITLGIALYKSVVFGAVPLMLVAAFSLLMMVLTFFASRKIVPVTYVQNMKVCAEPPHPTSLPPLCCATWALVSSSGGALGCACSLCVFAHTHKQEGDYRRTHVRMREFCESITFYGGQHKEWITADMRFGEALKV